MVDRLSRMLQRSPWTWGIGLGLVLALAATAVVRMYAVQAVESYVDARQKAVVQTTLATIEDRFARLREGLHGRARSLANDSSVVQGLQTWRERETRPGSLVRYASGLSLGARTAVEVYAPPLRVLAWKGRQIPVDSARFQGRIPTTPQTTVVADGSERRALAAWVPVRHEGRVLGAVRATRTIRYRPPIQNRYMRAMSLESRWAQETGEMVRVQWASTPPPSPHRILQGIEGTVLGYVSVSPPTPDRLIQRTASFYTDLLVGWAVLLIGWGLGGVVVWYVRLARRTGLRRHRGARVAAVGRLAVVVLLAVAARYTLLWLEVPGRWVAPGDLLAPLFDPTYFATTIGGGIFRSIGDLLLTGLWAGGIATGTVYLARHYRPRADAVTEFSAALQSDPPQYPHAGRYLSTFVLLAGASIGGVVVLAHVVRRAVLDSTLDFFSRTGLLPEPLVLGVLCGLFLLVAASVLVGIAGTWMALRRFLIHRPRQWPRGIGLVIGTGLFGACLTTLYLGTNTHAIVSLAYMLGALGGVGALSLYGLVETSGGKKVFTLRGLLGAVFAVTLLLYPLLYTGMDAKRREHMVDAVRSFERGQDPRVLYSIQRVLRSASETLAPRLQAGGSDVGPQIDSVATRLVRQSLLASLATYEVRLSVLGNDGQVRRRYAPAGRVERSLPDRAARRAYAALRPLHEQHPGPTVRKLPRTTTERSAGRGHTQYGGLLSVSAPSKSAETWVLVQIESQSLLPGAGFGVPRVLLPEGSFSDLYARLSLAEFREGTLVRSYGEDFGRTRLQPSMRNTLKKQTAMWHREVMRGRRHLTYYRRFSQDAGASPSVAAVRIPAVLAFDHLYYLLRLTVAGLCVGLLAYLFGLYVRYRRGYLPASRVRFRNKVLNAFLVVGIVSMVAVGVVGVRVVTGENERVVEQRMHDHLARVEETLALEAGPNERLWRAARQMNIDSLAARVGLELHLYEDGQLARTSQPRLLRDDLIPERLPSDVYHALHEEAHRFVTAKATIGQFRYRVGYQALVDAEGRPQLVVGVPTLAQQERLQEEQSRTLAYLFGALLILVVVVVLTGVVLANALAQPIAQLREGLEAVGEGRFARALSVDTRDEIGDLVQTFNEMRDQLAESRRKLARQERELAWREMARQVAHEIKNPLTPMKLSVQHLRQAFERSSDVPGSSRFAEMFDRITGTLIEQVESLVRIADEFSTFARLPTRVTEPVDLNETIQEAVSLMEEETANHAAIELNLHDEPLVVEADREELRRIYINLLKNALQAIPEDRDGCVRVKTQWTGKADGESPMVQSRVADNGTGIPPDLRDKIFEPNFSTKTGGTGLGLAIAQKSIGEHGGEIDFETAEGEGTTFWVRLPPAEDGASTY
jgi:signal transduction histidine kinase